MAQGELCKENIEVGVVSTQIEFVFPPFDEQVVQK